MDIERITDKWFEQTFGRVQKDLLPPTEDDLFIVGVLFTARKYTRAALSLLGQMHVLPAKALVRVLCELYVNILWCLNVEGDTKEEITNAVHERFQSWDSYRITKDKKLLADMREYATGDFARDVCQSLKKAEEGVREYETRDIQKMKSVASLCAELSRDSDKEAMKKIYVEMYRNYSRAVHLDRNTFSHLVRYESENDRIACYDDWEEDIGHLYANCLCMACDINMLLRRHYGFPEGNLREECMDLVSKCDG
jgi:hypothetical protein